MTRDMLEEKLRSAEQIATKYNISTNIDDLIDNMAQYWLSYTMTSPKFKQCILPWFSSYISVEGDMLPCCSLGDEAIMGNILKEGIDKAWNSPRYQEFRKEIKAGKLPFAECRHCIPKTLADMLKLRQILPGFLK
jgi:radical SAM protein with 4Fe4S-binding SPASM domain